MKHLNLSFFLLIILYAAVFICGNSCQSASFLPDSRSKALNICISADVSSLDPRSGSDATSRQIIRMLFEGLMYCDQEGNVIPALAESYEVSEDKKTYIFHLRDSQWSSGIDVTAYDFEYSWKSVIDRASKRFAMLVHHFYIIKNVNRYRRLECDIDSVGIQALDSRTLKVELENPVSYFLESLSNTWFYPVSKIVDQARYKWSHEVGKVFVCNGPFLLIEHKLDDKICLEKNPLFWDAKHVHLQKVGISVIKDEITRLCLFERGKLDWLGKPLCGLPLDTCAILKKENRMSIDPALGIYWYFFNTQRFPFNNKNMRKAFAYAIQREEITDYVLQSDEIPAHGVLPPEFGITFDPIFIKDAKENAKKYFALGLQELGIEKENLPELSLSYNSDETHRNVAQVIQQQIYTILGVKIRLRHNDWKIHYSNLCKGDFCIGGMIWQSWIRDPMYFLQTFRDPDDGINMSHWQNIQFNQLLQESDQEMNPAKRMELFKKAHGILIEEVPVIPVYFTKTAYIKSPKLQGINVLDNFILDFRHAYFSEEK